MAKIDLLHNPQGRVGGFLHRYAQQQRKERRVSDGFINRNARNAETQKPKKDFSKSSSLFLNNSKATYTETWTDREALE